MSVLTVVLLLLPVSTAQTLTPVVQFNGANGAHPQGLIQGLDGNFYGLTYDGGTAGAKGNGTVFKVTPSGTLTTLYNFCVGGDPCSDGKYPDGLLVQDANGNLYGTTQSGGLYVDGCDPEQGCGTIFKITPSGQFNTLYNFCSQAGCSDGIESPGSLIRATDGNFYGTTTFGGVGNGGTIFKFTKDGVLTTLYRLCTLTNCSDGGLPQGGLVQASDRTFYGTAAYGGYTDQQGQSHGTVFSISSEGQLTTLCIFVSQCAGTTPFAAPTQGPDQTFYGTTGSTIFAIDRTGTVNTTHVLTFADGTGPIEPLVYTGSRRLYGAAYTGGILSCNCGTIFSADLNGALTVLYDFGVTDPQNPPEGSFPFGLLQDTDGSFYGAAKQGGGSDACLGGCGTIFKLSNGLPPFVVTNPTAGRAGSTVIVLGTDLTGTTRVTFNGTPAHFKVVSASEITAIIPAGATAGVVKVATPGGIIMTNLPFRVQK